MFRIRLKELRETNGYASQRAFGKEFGVAQSTVGGWESGAREPDFTTLKSLATFFNVSVDYLLGNSDINNNELAQPTAPYITAIDKSSYPIFSR